MVVDKNKPTSWRPFKPSLCRECIATCCTMPLEVRIDDLVRLELVSSDEAVDASKKDIQKLAKRLQQNGIIKNYRESTGLFLMAARPNGDCQFLNKERHCVVYEKRPDVCRKFPEKMGLRLGYCPFLKKTKA